MNLLQKGVCDVEGVFLRQNQPDTRDETITLRKLEHTSPNSRIRIRFGRPPTPPERNISFSRDKPIGTNFSEVVRVMPNVIPTQNIVQDTFLDNEVGDTIRYIKKNLGDAPLINAYEAALAISKESNKKWKEYLEEEARLQSLFEED